MDDEHKKKQQHLMLLVGIALLVAIGWELLSGGRGAVRFHTEDDAMTLQGPEGTSVTIPYEEITEVTLVEDFDPGSPVSGGTHGNVRYGTWQNDTLGEYEAFLYTGIPDAVVIRAGDQVTAFNYENADTTEELAAAILDFSRED